MSKISAMLDVGKRSMMNSQTALQTVSHNIANKSTEGYSRQRVEQVTNEPVGNGKLRIGMGARAASVRRINNEFLEKQLANESNKLGYSSGQAENLGRVEQIFNEQINKGLNQFVGNFFNAFRELANNPESLATRTLVKETAHFLTQDFKRINEQLKTIQKDIDKQIETGVEEINAMTAEIAKLNEKISLVEIQGVPANDERDRRDVLVKKLGEKVNIRVAEGNNGIVTITAGNTGVLVSGYENINLKVASTEENGTKREGQVDILYQQTPEGTAFKITEQITGGQLGGALHVRDKVVNEMRDRVDVMAYQLAKSVNDAHSLGFNTYNQTGVSFFELPKSVRDASEHLKLNKEIMNDVSKISSSAQLDSPGDNRVANVIASIQHQNIMDGGTATLGDSYNGMVGRLAVMTNKANTEQEHQTNIVSQLKNVRESISGVSLDEEAVKMIEFQKAFDASARVIKVADEMLDTVLNLRR